MSNISSISPLFLCALSLSAFIGLVEGQIEMTKQTMGEERGGSCEKVPPFNYLHTHSFIHSFIHLLRQSPSCPRIVLRSNVREGGEVASKKGRVEGGWGREEAKAQETVILGSKKGSRDYLKTPPYHLSPRAAMFYHKEEKGSEEEQKETNRHTKQRRLMREREEKFVG